MPDSALHAARLGTTLTATGSAAPQSLLERMPKWLICVPLVVQWLWLSLKHRSTTLPSAANPAITAGGLVGEGKCEYFSGMGALARAATAPWCAIAPAQRSSMAAVRAAKAAGKPVAPYADYFDLVGTNLVRLFLSLAFTGAFWLLLFLAGALFKLIGIDFVAELIGKPWFALPASGAMFAAAVQLTDVRHGLIRGIRTVALTLLSADDLAKGFQVTDANPLLGLEGRAALLRRLGRQCLAEPELFELEDGPRPGGLADVLFDQADETDRLPAPCDT